MDLPATITLGQFEAIDGARSAMLRCLPHEEARAESRLFNALIDALGFNTATTSPTSAATPTSLSPPVCWAA